MTLDHMLFERREVLLGLLAAVLLLAWACRRIARSERPDGPLSRIAMLIGLGWSSEAIWELTGRIPGFPAGPRLLLFAVFEILLVVSMIRADRHVREHGWPGRAGNTAWTIAVSMGLVAAAVSHSLAEALLRLAIPLLLTKQWWDGLVGDQVHRPAWVTSWRWTPRRLLLRIGAIEPGERDVETVHRERLTQQMVRLEFRRRHGTDRQRERAAGRLARLSLSADDEIIGTVRAQVDRAMWFEEASEPTPVPRVSAWLAAREKAVKVRERRPRRRVCAAHPIIRERPVQVPREDTRSAQQKELAVRAVKIVYPKLPQREIARVTDVPPSTVRGLLRALQPGQPTVPVNGRHPELRGEDRK
ncbi:hypothetical protein AB0M02_00535 [Actinoplanes sp. NPDC051861]|uniref:hypothetical protein n=1 Tax=Actinoplanes sp. NPDC051861 TaxID=3155170 RepID=UPI00343F25DC